jgi:cbb3-type cytochrome oxidase maturation protein
MSISYLLVALGLGVFVLAVWALFWAIDAGQYENLEEAASSILEDDDDKSGTDKSGTDLFIDDEDIVNK